MKTFACFAFLALAGCVLATGPVNRRKFTLRINPKEEKCLQFEYRIKPNKRNLTVVLKIGDASGKRIWSASGSHESWKRTSIGIHEREQIYTIVFKGLHYSDRTRLVAIRYITVNDGPCFKAHRAADPQLELGDSKLQERMHGRNFFIIAINPKDEKCLQFEYRVKPVKRKLTVALKMGDAIGKRIWSASGGRGEGWKMASIGIAERLQMYKIVFEGVRYADRDRPVAIRFITINDGPCNGGEPEYGREVTIAINPRDNKCLKFEYRINPAESERNLTVALEMGGAIGKPIWSAAGGSGEGWKTTSTRINERKKMYRIVFEGVRNDDRNGPVAIRYVTLNDGFCNRGGPELEFDDSEIPGELYCTIAINPKDEKCLHFDYRINPPERNLTVALKIGDAIGKRIWSAAGGDRREDWKKTSIGIHEREQMYRIAFEGIRDANRNGPVAIRSITLNDGPCIKREQLRPPHPPGEGQETREPAKEDGLQLSDSTS